MNYICCICAAGRMTSPFLLLWSYRRNCSEIIVFLFILEYGNYVTEREKEKKIFSLSPRGCLHVKHAFYMFANLSLLVSSVI